MNDLWLCLRFPQLPLDLLAQDQSPQHQLPKGHLPRGHLPGGHLSKGHLSKGHLSRGIATEATGTDPSSPRVVVEQQRIHFASASARAAGIDVGMSLSTALALCGELRAVTRDRQQEAKCLQALAHWCYQFTPCVSVRAAQPGTDEHCANDSILLEISACLRLFHGLDNLLELIATGLQQQGYHSVTSLAHTPQAAWLLGQVPDLNPLTASGQLHPDGAGQALDRGFFLARLRQVPLALLPCTDKQQRQLQQVGFRNLGDLLALPPASLARRYSKALAQQLDKLSGGAPDLQYYLQPSQRFYRQRHYLSGLTSVAMVQHPVAELLQELHHFLLDRQLQCQGFSWRFCHFDKSTSELAIELSTAQNQYRNFYNLSLLKLHDFRIGSPIETVQLHSSALLASQARSRPLFSELGLQAQHDRHQLLDTLRTRLGSERLYQLVCLDEHLPEYRQATDSAIAASTPAERGKAHKARAPQQDPPATTLPLWLLPQPLRLRQPQQLEIISGAQRIDSHWWQQRQQRSYFVARDQRGSHWIFYDAGCQQWFLHGHFG